MLKFIPIIIVACLFIAAKILTPKYNIQPEVLISTPNKVEEMAEFWGLVYQSTQDASKNSAFIKHSKLAGSAPKEEEIQNILNLVVNDAFYGDFGIDAFKLKDFLYLTALHESRGGKYDEQVNGPAMGWWQVEPTTARDVLKNSSPILGKRAQYIMGYSLKELNAMGDEEFRQTLKKPEVNAVFAAAKTIVAAKYKNQLNFLRK